MNLLAQLGNVPTDYGAADAANAAGTAVAAGGFAAVAIGMMIFWIIFGLGGLILFIIALIDVIRREFPNPNDKILWIILILLLSWIGPILYFIIGKKKGTIPAAKTA